MSKKHAGRGGSGSDLTRSERLQMIAAGPVMIAGFVALPLVLAGPLSLWQGSSYAEALDWIASGVAEDYYDIVGVVATVLVALAAATNLGVAERMLGDRARAVVLTCVFICAFLLAALAAALVSDAVVRPDRTMSAAVGLIVAWLCLLVAQTVTGAATAGERARSARETWKRRQQQAAEFGIDRKQLVPVRLQVFAEIALWGAPLACWALVALGLTAQAAVPEESRGTLVVLALFLYYGNIIFTIGWRVTSDLSDSRRSRVVVRWFTGTIGAVLTVVLGMLMATVVPALGWGLILFSAVHLGALMVVVPRTPVGDVIQRAETVRSLRRARANRILRSKQAKQAKQAAGP